MAVSSLASSAAASDPRGPGDLPMTPELVRPYQTPNVLMTVGDPDPQGPGVFACVPPTPESVDARKCCLGTKAAPINANSLGNYFCYCTPSKIISVCGTVGGQGAGAPIKENADWCVFASTHPQFPKVKRSCN
ncbi:MAG: hypothetical protein JNJ59_07310 [Deltaproteobacteria bacterium]|nr:hypothetical protein [Deltaproteobacteria bacterium]